MVPVGFNEHLVFDDFLGSEEALHIAKILKRDEHKILSIPNTSSTGYKGTTAQYSVYNLLTHPDIRPMNIPDRIFELPFFQPTKENWYSELWVQCWGNVLHQGQNLPVHCHAEKDQPVTNDLIACSIYLDGKDPCYTHWEDGKQINQRGTLHVAGKFHEHEVKTNVFTEPRISMAFDIYWNTDEVLKNTHRRFLHIHRPTHKSTDHLRRHSNFKENKETLVYESDFEGMPIVVKTSSMHTKLYFAHETEEVQTIILNNNPTTLWYTYVQQLCGVTKYVKEPNNALVLGLGGGVMPSWIKENTKSTDIDVVEIIPELETIARQHFHMPESINVIIDDAFKFVHTTTKKYDIIIVDVSDMTQFTDEFYQGLHSILTKTGCVAINYFAWKDSPEHNRHLKQLHNHFNWVENNINYLNNNCITYCSQTKPTDHGIPNAATSFVTKLRQFPKSKQIDSNATWGPLGE
jgi:spermidine synthase